MDYRTRKQPIQETPKTRGGLILPNPKRNRTFSGPSSLRSLQTSPKQQDKFIHGGSLSSRSKPFIHHPDMTRSVPRYAVTNSEPTKTAPPFNSLNRKPKQQMNSKMYRQDDSDESRKLIEGVEDKKESWLHESGKNNEYFMSVLLILYYSYLNWI